MGDDIVGLSTENESWKNNTSFYDKKGLELPTAMLLKQIDDEKKAKLIRSKIEKQKEKW